MWSYICSAGRILFEVNHNIRDKSLGSNHWKCLCLKKVKCKERPSYKKCGWLHVHIISLENAPKICNFCQLFQYIIWCISLCCYTFKKIQNPKLLFYLSFCSNVSQLKPTVLQGSSGDLNSIKILSSIWRAKYLEN